MNLRVVDYQLKIGCGKASSLLEECNGRTVCKQYPVIIPLSTLLSIV